MPKKSIRKAASGILPHVVDIGCGYNYVAGGMLAGRAYIRYGETAPLVAICATWRADQVLYGSCTLVIYSDDIVLCVFTQDSRSWQRGRIEEFSAV